MADMDSLHPPTVCLSDAVIKEFKRILAESEITKWVFSLLLVPVAPRPGRKGRMASFFSFVSSVWLIKVVPKHHRQDDDKWPKKNVVGKQELEVKLAPYHISFQVRSLSRSLSPPTYRLIRYP